MVRTYAFNASSRSEFFEAYKHTVNTPTPKYQPNNSAALLNESEQANNGYLNNDNREVTQSSSNSNSDFPSFNNQENSNQTMAPYFPPINQSNIYQSSLHSSMIDPIGSIVGMRLVYMNGQLVYVPVEPHINMIINKQFGGSGAPPPPVMLPQIQPNVPILAQNANAMPPTMTQSVPSQIIHSQSKQDVNENRLDPPYSQYQQVPARQSANQQYRNNAMLSKFGSLPNLGPQSKPFISSQEQHKLELQQQIEENKRRRELEKQKELEIEQKEIRKWEEYQKRIREEDEMERRQIQEKAKAMELRNQQVYARQQVQPRQKGQDRERRKPPPPSNQPDYISEDDEPIQNLRRTRHSSDSFSDYQERRPNSRSTKNRSRQEQHHHQETRELRPDSSQPRKVEWWEKKASWQDRTDRNQSAVIPTLRGKPPAVPDSQRSGYDSSGNVGEHQSRASSRTPSSTQRSSNSHSEEPIGRNVSGVRRAPEAFTISG
uniref:Uncharacterized protein n=1 Tax=Caenorhabditis japonica TaxID=281687 RepID=A0A8R1HRT2_CAEJA